MAKTIEFDVTLKIDGDKWDSPNEFMVALLRDKVVKNYSGPRLTAEQWTELHPEDGGDYDRGWSDAMRASARGELL